MPSRSRRNHKSAHDPKAEVDKILSLMLKQAKIQFGDAVKSFWFYAGELCPGCLARPIGVIRMKGENALSLNAFIYRPRGVLIGYFLCEVCANYILKEVEKNPYRQTPLHADIERNLAEAYLRYLSSLDA